MSTSTLSSKFQVSIPKALRDRLSWRPGQKIAFIAKADGVLIVTPEHNRSIPTALKNAIDWGARPWGKSNWPGKPGFITGTSPGAIGTALVQANLRTVMLGLGMTLLGGESYVQFKPTLIDDENTVTDEGTRKFLQDFVDRFAILVTKLKA